MAMEIELHRVLDALPSMIWTVLTNGKVEFVNRRWVEYTGVRHSDRDGWKWQDTVEPEDLQALIEQWQAIEASGEVGDITARIRSRSGELVIVHSRRQDAGSGTYCHRTLLCRETLSSSELLERSARTGAASDAAQPSPEVQAAAGT
jgi:PAS domain S-box-containing protein